VFLYLKRGSDMADEGEYELLPHEEIQKLRDELDKLKKNPLGTTSKAKDLQTSVFLYQTLEYTSI
jgi:hypothetical protein